MGQLVEVRHFEAIYEHGEVDVDDLVWIIRQIQTEFPGQKVFSRNSAGALTCILAASQVQVDGVFMRYPVLTSKVACA